MLTMGKGGINCEVGIDIYIPLTDIKYIISYTRYIAQGIILSILAENYRETEK